MPKTRRVQIRLTEEDHALLMEKAQEYGGITSAIEVFLHRLRPAAIVGVRRVGSRGRVSLSIRFSNGMVVHGFLWSRGGQLLAPRHRDGDHMVRHLDGSREFWVNLREFCRHWFTAPAEVEQEPEYEEVGTQMTS
jgi:hypothetical protein